MNRRNLLLSLLCALFAWLKFPRRQFFDNGKILPRFSLSVSSVSSSSSPSVSSVSSSSSSIPGSYAQAYIIASRRGEIETILSKHDWKR